MGKAEKTLFNTVIFLVVCLCVLFVEVANANKEKTRYKENCNVLQEQFRKYKTKDSLSAISVGELIYKTNELKDANSELVKACNDMGIKIKRLESASQNSSTTVIEKTVPIYDTIIKTDTAWVNFQAFSYKDTWNSVEGLINGTNVECKIAIQDTLTQVVYRVPHKFLFFKWGTKEIRQDCRTSNPYTQMEYSQYIKIK